MDSADLLTSPDPSVAYRADRRLAGARENDADQQRRRRLVAGSENVARILTGRRPDGTVG